MKGEQKTRGFVITNWNTNWTKEDYEKLVNKGQIRFIAYGDEICPDTKRPHHQAFCYFYNLKTSWSKRTWNNIGKMFKVYDEDKHANVKPMLGNFAQNESYCSKDDLYTKVGDEPKQGFRGDLEETKDEIMNGNISVDDIALTDPMMFHKYGRTLSRIEEIAFRRKFRTEMTEGVWLTGPSGSGKSHTAFEGYHPDTHYVKNLNEDWWDGYKGQPIVILNEFRGQIKFSELLDLMDKYPKTVKWRCKEPVPFLAKKIIITSIKLPWEVYSNTNGEPWSQFERRCTVKNVQTSLEQKYSEGNNETSESKRKKYFEGEMTVFDV